MIGNLKVLSVIPARGGSKGLPGKNIFPVNGKPLLSYSVIPSLNSKYIDKTVVSSDNSEILDVAAHYGADIIDRPLHLATDTASSESVIEHTLSICGNFDILILLQPTSPLRTVKHIDAALELFIEKRATALISVYEPAHTPFKTFVQNTAGFMKGLVDNEAPFKRRQDLPKAYMPNGAIYIIYVHDFLSTKSLFTDKTIPFIMAEDESIDVDTKSDIIQVSEKLKNIV